MRIRKKMKEIKGMIMMNIYMNHSSKKIDQKYKKHNKTSKL